MCKNDRCPAEEIYVIGFIPSYCLPKKRPCSLDPFLDPFISEAEELFISAVESSSATGVKYYFGDNRYHTRHPFDRCNLLEDLETMKEIDQEDRKSIRSKMSRNTGYTGLSILHRLYKLYGFNVLTDFVFDMMHNLPMNVVSNHLQMLINSDKIDKNLTDDRLSAVPWSPGIASRLGFWKAEEYQKFAYPVSECILAGQLDGLDYHIWQLVTRMVELVFSQSMREGWDITEVDLFHNLAQRYAILMEETYGLQFCKITVHNLFHVKEDAMRFSHPDNYWCFSFERAVNRYVNTSTNFKNIECTYAKMEKRRELMKLLNTSFLLQDSRRKPLIIDVDKMCAKNLEAAYDLIKIVSESHISQVNRCNKGVLVGGMSSNECTLLREQKLQIEDCFDGVNVQDVQEMAFKFKSLLKPLHGSGGVLYRVGEHVIINDVSNVETVIELMAFYCVPIGSVYLTFCEGKKYDTMEDDDGNLTVHQYSGHKFVAETPNVTILCPSQIYRKIMLFPCFDQEDNNDLIAVDYLRKQMPVLQNGIAVPFYPKTEMSKLFQDYINNDQFAYKRGRNTTLALLKCQDFWLRALDGNADYVRILSFDFSKAFDTVPHQIVCDKLKTTSLNPYIINWIIDFLADRKQRVVVNGLTTDLVKINRGVPQGTVLGPVLFSLMVNDITTANPNSNLMVKYADDITVCAPVTASGDSALSEVNSIKRWADVQVL
ncbi:RNA-directed DNA polymerase from mobile element jockey [Exaiptasia diaphana]|nr:RNA-directed DNA polymerase from mobile element jockey [Exaiptasia diaphana]